METHPIIAAAAAHFAKVDAERETRIAKAKAESKARRGI